MNKMKYSIHSSKGISLVEMLLSMALVSIAVFAIIGTVAQSAVFSRRVDMQYAASNLASQRMDMVRSLNFTDIQSADEDAVRVDIYGDMDAEGDYLRTTEVFTDHEGNDRLVRVKVTVKVSHIDMLGRKEHPAEGHEVILETLISDL